MNVIIAHWKDGKTGVYSSLVSFVRHHPEYSIHTLYHYLTRKKKPFEDDRVKLEKMEVQKLVKVKEEN